jgi:hypothetical protein
MSHKNQRKTALRAESQPQAEKPDRSHVVDSIQCASCNELFRLDSRAYMTIRGAVSVGESLTMTTAGVRVCFKNGCAEKLFTLSKEKGIPRI